MGRQWNQGRYGKHGTGVGPPITAHGSLNTWMAAALSLCFLWIGVLGLPVFGADALRELRVDFGKSEGVMRRLHGINKGPLAPGGLIDVTEPLRALGPPFARLHDCHWPNPDVVDIHAVFPNFEADPALESSYDFTLTDEYVAATRRTGAEIVYRLGESIEHTSVKRFVHPPKDFRKWTAIGLGIIRHYNEGWGNGHRYGIRYWEIWNEPENRPAMWSGSDDDYFRLYRVAATEIKGKYPQVKVGGPAVGYSGQFIKGVFQPGAFVTNFLALCRHEAVPLDFFSWHCYSADPSEPAARARAIRRLLDDYGFGNTESHLNEWNYLPGNSWKPLSRSSAPEIRQQFYDQMAGAEGGAFLVTALMELQSAPVEVCNMFHGELSGFGLFNENGVPNKAYHALLAFSELAATSRRVEAHGAVPGHLAVAAGVNTNSSAATILVSNVAVEQGRFELVLANLPWSTGTRLEIRRVSKTENLDRAIVQTNNAAQFTVALDLPSPGVALIRLHPLQGAGGSNR